jgi:23S rRNA pseudouridine1911/1915/1917 synthase
LIIVARNPAALRHLQREFKARRVEKTYLALVEGQLQPPQGLIDAPIGRHPRQRRRMAVLAQGGREARTAYRVLEYLDRFSLVEVRPLTGRTHQIRVHLAAVGHPVVGDQMYGRRRQRLALNRPFLHAWKLTLTLPSGEERTFVAPLPPDLRHILQELGATAPEVRE